MKSKKPIKASSRLSESKSLPPWQQLELDFVVVTEDTSDLKTHLSEDFEQSKEHLDELARL